MHRSSGRLPAVLIITGGLVVVTSLFFLSDHLQTWVIVAGVALMQSCLLAGPRSAAADAEEEIATERQELEAWHADQSRQLQEETERLHDRQRELTHRLTQLQEFLEYPVADSDSASDTSAVQSIRLSEQDRTVHQLLETEAERVYEKIRANGYSDGDGVNLPVIRDELIDLVQRVARVYQPDSVNPLMETSFEQLARSASRICLHSLVLLEQLPLDVKNRNINELYGYIRKAVVGYGAYQQVAPWLRHLSRGAYAGRIAAGANPVALGAWWLATEVGRRGAARLIENVVDRQAVAALNDIVTIVGVEVANIYGPGFRQRDAAWVYGAELTELLHRFPISRESLQHGLREITSLPLRSEYDRVYLYRCVAQHRSSGLRLSDPAILTRPEREHIATQLEQFFATSIHGVTPEEQQAWQDDVEARLDLKMKLSDGAASSATSGALVTAAVRSIHAFLTSICAVSAEESAQFLESSDLLELVPLQDRTGLLAELRDLSDLPFSPPDLDPGSDLTHSYLTELLSGTVVMGTCDAGVRQLLLETVCYFRRHPDEAQALLDESFRTYLQSRCHEGVSIKHVPAESLHTLRANLADGHVVFAAYGDVTLSGDEGDTELLAGVLCVSGTAVPESAWLVDAEQLRWQFDDSATIDRIKGYFVDDCEIQGGIWSGPQHSHRIVLETGLTSGGFSRKFEELLRLRAM